MIAGRRGVRQPFKQRSQQFDLVLERPTSRNASIVTSSARIGLHGELRGSCSRSGAAAALFSNPRRNRGDSLGGLFGAQRAFARNASPYSATLDDLQIALRASPCSSSGRDGKREAEKKSAPNALVRGGYDKLKTLRRPLKAGAWRCGRPHARRPLL